jgi:ferredoxin
MTNLHIDWTRCDGHGLCAALLPTRITRDEWGFPVLAAHAVRDTEVTHIRRAIALCPALALHLDKR